MSEYEMMKQIIIDTDMGPDDWITILFLGNHSKTELKAISISGTGESHGKQGALNCKRLLSLVNKEDIPIAFGQGNPLSGTNHFPNIMRWVMDKMLFLKIPKSYALIETANSIEIMRRELEKSSKKITILAIGPLTNIALLIQQHPTLINKIEKIVIMGGAIDVPGNIKEIRFLSKNEWAEWNIYCDPHAANIVFKSGIPIILVPLDATNKISVDLEFVESLVSQTDNTASVFAGKVLQKLGSRVNKGSYFLWDVIAAAVMLDPSIATIDSIQVYVEEEGISMGRILRDEEKGSLIEVCRKVDKNKFKSMILDTFSN